MAIQPLPGSGAKPPRQVKHGLDRVVRSLGLPSSSAVQTIFQAWENVVGEELAKHCRPTAIKKGNLTVTATDQAWATELKWMETTLLERCSQELGDGSVTSVTVIAQR